LAGWRVVKSWFARIRTSRWRTTKCIGQNSNPTMQFIINATEQPPAFQLIRGDAETCEHDHENKAIPDLQPPSDGSENFHSMQ
jgi:hypothetical protein